MNDDDIWNGYRLGKVLDEGRKKAVDLIPGIGD